MSAALWKKLNLKDQPKVVVVGAPAEFETHVDALETAKVQRSVRGKTDATFLIAFAITRQDIERAAKAIAKLPDGDVIAWVCYPKKSSKRYACEFDRDTGWEPLGELGYEGVRMVAIDEDWSAIRFRRVDHIKNLTRDRSWRLSEKGRKR